VIVEWNHHLWSQDTETYPYHPDARYAPSTDFGSVAPLEEYEHRLDDLGIDRAVIVQPEPYGDDHSLILDCVARDPDRFRATSLFYPTDPEAPDKLRALVDEHGDLVVATRIHSYDHYMSGFDDEGVRSLWGTAADLGLIVELHLTPPFARGAAELVQRHPETPVVVDHLAEPQDGTAVEYADVLDLAKHDNVFMKLSGLGHFAEDPPLYESARPFTRRVVDAFGPGRMLWGGGTPDIVDAHLPDHPETERERVRGNNAAELVWGE
jgi:predicted TIM-barrel fold metal-dependent hydrolase